MMKKLITLILISFTLTSCFIYTKGEDGKPGKPGENGKTGQKVTIEEKASGFNIEESFTEEK